MHFQFMKVLFSEYETDIRVENGIEKIYIRNRQFEDAIVICYFPDGYYTYLLCFATQHLDISSKEELIECARSFANVEKAAIEFYENGRNQFGGEIDVSQLDEITYEELRQFFGYPYRDLIGFEFKVRAWDRKYCFDGSFTKKENGDVAVIKKYVDDI